VAEPLPGGAGGGRLIRGRDLDRGRLALRGRLRRRGRIGRRGLGGRVLSGRGRRGRVLGRRGRRGEGEGAAARQQLEAVVHHISHRNFPLFRTSSRSPAAFVPVGSGATPSGRA